MESDAGNVVSWLHNLTGIWFLPEVLLKCFCLFLVFLEGKLFDGESVRYQKPKP